MFDVKPQTVSCTEYKIITRWLVCNKQAKCMNLLSGATV